MPMCQCECLNANYNPRHRMIKNLQKIDRFQSFKSSLMLFIIHIIRSEQHNSAVLIFVRTLIATLASLSLLFLQDPLSPQIINSVFRFFDIAHLPMLFSFSYQIMLIVFAVFEVILVFFVALSWAYSSLVLSPRIVSVILQLSTIFVAPISYLMLENVRTLLNKSLDAGESALRVLVVVGSLINIGMVCLYSYFNIQPLRLQNIQWNYNHIKPFKRMLLSIGRAVCIFAKCETSLMLVMSLIIEINLYTGESCWLCPQAKLIDKCHHLLVILVHVVLLTSSFEINPNIVQLMMILSFVIYIGFIAINLLYLKHQSEQLPICKKENRALFYEFFLEFKARKEIKYDFSNSISLHKLVCDLPDCIFRCEDDSESKVHTVEEVEQKISNFLKKYRYDCSECELMYEIWKMELNKPTYLSLNLRPFKLEHQYVVEFVVGAGSSMRQKNDLNTEQAANQEHSNVSNTNFYKQLEIAVDEFEKLGETLSKPLPEVNEIIGSVINIDRETTILTEMFREMIERKQVSYICIQLFLKYYDSFFSENKLPVDVTDKLKRLKILIDSNVITEKPVPCFMIDASTTFIENCNALGMKMLRIHRYEFNDKPLSTFFTVEFNPNKAYQMQLKNQKESSLPVFLTVNFGDKSRVYCMNIFLKPLQMNNKNYFEVTFSQRSSSNIVEFLVDQNSKIVAATSRSFLLAFPDKKISYDIDLVYENSIEPLLSTISPKNIGRVDFQEECLVSGMISEKHYPFNQNYRMFTLSFMRKINSPHIGQIKSKARISRTLALQAQFNFSYKFSPDHRLELVGKAADDEKNLEVEMENNGSVKSMTEDFSYYIGKLAQVLTRNIKQGIKVYRLYQGDLYNIDLEERAIYEQQFSESAAEISAVQKNCEVKAKTQILVAALICLAIFVVAISLFNSITIGSSLTSIQKQQSQMLQIGQYSLNYNCIISLLRNSDSPILNTLNINMTSNFLDLYSDLQKVDPTYFFSETVRSAIYAGYEYRGSLSELIEIGLEHVYEQLQEPSDKINARIHEYSVLYIGPLLLEESRAKNDLIYANVTYLRQCSIICFWLIVGGSLLYIMVYITISRQYKKNLNTSLEPLLLLPEQETKRIIEECQKFKNVISSCYKNYEVDLDVIQKKNEGSRQRVTPKRANFGVCAILTELLIATVTLILLSGLASLQYGFTFNETNNLVKFFQESKSVMGSYSSLCWAISQIDYFKTVNTTTIDSISSMLDKIEYDMNSYEFSNQLSDMVQITFFQDSCDWLTNNQIIKSKWCGNSVQDFFGKPNPFKIGLSIYYRHMSYSLMANITQVQISNSIFSQPLKKFSMYMSKKIQSQTAVRISNLRTSENLIGAIVIILSAWLLFMFAISYVLFSISMGNIEKGLLSLLGEYKKKQENENENESVGDAVTFGDKIDQEYMLIATNDAAREE